MGVSFLQWPHHGAWNSPTRTSNELAIKTRISKQDQYMYKVYLTPREGVKKTHKLRISPHRSEPPPHMWKTRFFADL